jgi:hypothetical protein
MNWIVPKIKWIMIVSGTLTFTMIFAAIDPQAALRQNFGETLDGPVANIVVRNWGALIALIGAMLIYGAWNPPVRGMALTAALVSKLVFIGLVVSHGASYLSQQVGIAVVVDLVMIALFAWYLLAAPNPVSRA